MRVMGMCFICPHSLIDLIVYKAVQLLPNCVSKFGEHLRHLDFAKSPPDPPVGWAGVYPSPFSTSPSMPMVPYF